MEQNSLARTSPSNLRRRQLCPGSARLEYGQPDIATFLGAEGKLLHNYWANRELDRSFLSNAQRDILVTADDLVAQVLARLKELDESFRRTTDRERYLEMSDPPLDGTPDLVYHWPTMGVALVSDLKSGFAAQEGAGNNMQLRGYAILVAANYTPIERVFVSILMPRRTPRERITLAIYDTEAIKKSREQINRIIDATMQPDAPLRAGEEQCRYCRAQLDCPAFRAAVTKGLLPLVPTDSELSKTAREAHIVRKIKACSDDELEKVLVACKLAEFIAEAAGDEARERIKAGKFVKYYLGKESEVRVLGDVGRAIGLLTLSGVITRQQAYKLCSLPLGDVEEIYREANPGTTWKEARDKIDRVLKSVIKTETRRARILRKK